MRVLMICQDVRVDRRVILEAQTLADAGYDVSILARAEATGLARPDETDGGIPITRIQVEGRDPRFRWLRRLATVAGRRGYIGAVNAAKLWGSLTVHNTFSVLAYPWMIRHRADVYHAHDLINLPVAYRAARATEASLAYDAHELFTEIDNPWIRLRGLQWRHHERTLLAHCRLVTTVNELIAEEMAKRYRAPQPRVLYNCPRKPVSFDPRKRQPFLRMRLDLPPDTRILLYHGWMAKGRGLEEMIEGARYLRGAKAVLALMGYGDHIPRLQALAARHGLSDGTVRFVDPVPHGALVSYCASATAGVIPYRPVDLNNYYSSPNKLFDCIQAQIPILASDLPFLRKMVAGRNIGMVTPMTTPDSVGQAMLGMLKALDDAATATRWARNLHEAAEVYNWEREGAKLVGWFAERLGGP